MTDSILPTIPPPPRKAINTLAITSLVTGILAFLSSFCVIVILFAIVGLIAGIFHLREQ